MLETAYYLLFIGCVVAIGMALSRAATSAGYTSAEKRRFMIGYAFFFMAWAAYLSLLSLTGVLNTVSMPPRLPLLVILPAFAIIAYFFTANRFRRIISAFSIKFPVYYQSFRILVELLILGAYLKGLGPLHVTFEGYNFDILAGISAPIIGIIAFRNGKVATGLLRVWNICCLLLLANIVFIFNTLVLRPDMWGFASTPVSTILFQLPYLFIAGVYMPTAVFMHVFSFVKLRQYKKAVHQARPSLQ